MLELAGVQKFSWIVVKDSGLGHVRQRGVNSVGFEVAIGQADGVNQSPLENVSMAYTLALFLYRAKKPEQALQVLRPVVETQPGNREAANLFSAIMKNTQVR